MMHCKRYIGDGVYLDFDGFAYILTTEDGLRVTNRIVLEPQVIEAFDEYRKTPLVDLMEKAE